MIHGWILILLATVTQVTSFFIIKADPSLVVVEPGSKVTLFCEVDDHYEYCKFISPQKNKNNENLICDLEWKRKANNITMQDCDDLKDKNVEFHGLYDDKQCGITFVASEDDNGLWERRQRRRPDADAAVVFDRESKVNNDTTNMMRHPHDNISDNTRLSQDISIRDLHVTDHRNLHEFFPNSDSFA